ncbi:MAG: rhomboid family intramembrane serine protease [Elusimicrobia bacterium]|nr:rhomboid family intramembrane serine protease [Elusimicrobiota bacterium]MDE2313727.1 rhomboid family intramembrane serine protease [Elusimicrobiota bacterium]
MTRVFEHSPIDFRGMPPAVKGLIIVNVAVFLLTQLVGPQFYTLFGLVPSRVLQDRWLWQPVTYLFIHGGIWHLLFNMFALWMFGVPVESQWGTREFLKFYFICGVGAAAASLAMSPHSVVPVIGASGSIFGLLVAFAMLFPDAVVYLWFFFPIKASHMAVLFGILEFYFGATGSRPGIANFAHLGGMITGYVYLRWWWIWKIKAKAAMGVSRGEPFIRFTRPAPPRTKTAPSRQAAKRPPEAASMDDVDRILDKILTNGLESLTEDEREIMRRYSDKTNH